MSWRARAGTKNPPSAGSEGGDARFLPHLPTRCVAGVSTVARKFRSVAAVSQGQVPPPLWISARGSEQADGKRRAPGLSREGPDKKGKKWKVQSEK
jgi:hypothetical protein